MVGSRIWIGRLVLELRIVKRRSRVKPRCMLLAFPGAYDPSRLWI